MTGYGKAAGSVNSRNVQVEIRALNSKSADISLKNPSLLREKESEIRNLISQQLERGKFDVWISIEDTLTQSGQEIKADLIRNYYKQLKALQIELGDTESPLLPIIGRFPDIFAAREDSLSESEWLAFLPVLKQAISATREFRIREGESLSAAVLQHLSSIEMGLEQVPQYETKRIERIKERISKNLEQLQNFGDASDKNRFEQELIYYLEKLDISEEKTRLFNHCQYFRETLSEPNSQGKRLNFIAQEMGREINTLGSKANDSDLQRIVVGMKDDLEKIKELVLNIL
jgi:uncharacterized protein (TIGR00255 family)